MLSNFTGQCCFLKILCIWHACQHWYPWLLSIWREWKTIEPYHGFWRNIWMEYSPHTYSLTIQRTLKYVHFSFSILFDPKECLSMNDFRFYFFFFWFSVRATAPCGRNALICGSGTTRRPSINQPKSSCKNQKCLEKWLCSTSDGYRSNCFYIFLIPVYNFHDFVYIDIIEVYAVYVNHSIFFYFIGRNIRRRKKNTNSKTHDNFSLNFVVVLFTKSFLMNLLHRNSEYICFSRYGYTYSNLILFRRFISYFSYVLLFVCWIFDYIVINIPTTKQKTHNSNWDLLLHCV